MRMCSFDARNRGSTKLPLKMWETHPRHFGDNVHKQAWTDYLELLAAALLTAFLNILIFLYNCTTI